LDSANLQHVLDAVIDWCQKWQLNVNTLKCSVLHLGKDNLHFYYFNDKSEITKCLTVSDLARQFDPHLCFKSHIKTIFIKARCRCAIFLIICLSFSNLNVFFFTIYVPQLLEYGSVIWSPIDAAGIPASVGWVHLKGGPANLQGGPICFLMVPPL